MASASQSSRRLDRDEFDQQRQAAFEAVRLYVVRRCFRWQTQQENRYCKGCPEVCTLYTTGTIRLGGEMDVDSKGEKSVWFWMKSERLKGNT